MPRRTRWYSEHVTRNRGTRHTSHVTCHTSHVTRHTSHVTRHTSHVTRHTSHITRHTQVRRTVAASICDVAKALNVDIIVTDLFPVFDSFCRDIDEVKNVAVKQVLYAPLQQLLLALIIV